MTPGRPLALATSPDGTRVYAARKGAIDVIDTAAQQIVGKRAVAGTPVDMAVTATRAVVAEGNAVAIVNLQTGHLVRRIALASAAAWRSTAQGRAWVSTTFAPKRPRHAKHTPKPVSRLLGVNPGSGSIFRSIVLGTDGGGGVAVDAEGTRALVAPGAQLRGGIHRNAALVDLDKAKVLVRPPTGGGPGRAAWSADGVRIYVSDAHRGTVCVLSALSGARLSTLRIAGAGPADRAAGPGVRVRDRRAGHPQRLARRRPDRGLRRRRHPQRRPRRRRAAGRHRQRPL